MQISGYSMKGRITFISLTDNKSIDIRPIFVLLNDKIADIERSEVERHFIA